MTTPGAIVDAAPAGPGAFAPINAEYLVLAVDANLTDERVFTPSTGLSAVDGGAGGAYTLTVDLSTGVAGGQAAIGGTAAADDLTLRATAAVGIGDVIIEGDPATEYGRFVGAGTLQMTDGTGTAVSAAGTGRIRYNDTTKTWQISSDTAAYVDIATGVGAGPWDVTGTDVFLDTTTNDVIVGALPTLAKFTVRQEVETSGSPTAFYVLGGAHTTLASAEVTDVFFDLDRTVQFTTGGVIGIERAVRMPGVTYAATAATQTINKAVTLQVTGPTAGANVTIGSSFALEALGSVRIAGKLTVTGSIDPTDITLSGAGTAHWQQWGNGTTAPVSDAATGRIRYNDTTKTFQVSADTGAYVDIATGAGAGPWDVTAGVVHLDTAANTVTIGSAVAGSKLFIDGTTDQLQLTVEGAPAQTKGLANFRLSTGTDLWSMSISGSITQAQDAEVGSTTPFIYKMTGGSHTALVAAEVRDVDLALSRTVQFTTGGAIALQRSVVVDPVTFAATAATQTITTAATVAITGAPVAGANVAITNAFALDVTGDTRVTGKLTVTGSLDPTDITLSGGGTAHWQQWGNGTTAPVSDAATGRIRYNDTTKTFQVSADTGAYVDITTGAGPWDETGTDVFLDTTTNDVVVGALPSLGKFTVRQEVETSGSPSAVVFVGGAHTTLAASTEAIDVNVNLARTVQFATGALAAQRAFVIQAPTYAFVGASTITQAATLAITGAPAAGANATLTDTFALWVQAGQIAAADGSLANPAYSFASSTNSGMFIAEGDVRIARAANERFIASAGGTAIQGATGQVSLGIGSKSSGTPLSFRIGTGGTAHTGISNSGVTDVVSDYDPGISIAYTTFGALTTFYAHQFQTTTLSFSGAKTVTTASTVFIEGPPVEGANATFTNAFALDVAGDTRITGKLTVTGSIDPTDITLSGGGTSHWQQWGNGTTAPVSAAGTGRIRYNDSTGTFQVSISTAAYVDLATGSASPWTTTGTVIHPVVPTNTVAIGATTTLAGELLNAVLSANAGTFITVENATNGTGAFAGVNLESSAGKGGIMLVTPALFTPVVGRQADSLVVSASAGVSQLQLNTEGADPITFYTTGTERMRIDGAAPVLLIQAVTALAPSNDHIQGDKTLNGTYNGMRARNLSAGTAAIAEFIAQNDSALNMQAGITSSGYTGSPFAASQAFIQSTGGGGLVLRNSAAAVIDTMIGTTSRTRVQTDGQFTVSGTATSFITRKGYAIRANINTGNVWAANTFPVPLLLGLFNGNTGNVANAYASIELFVRDTGTAFARIAAVAPSANNSHLVFATESGGTVFERLRLLNTGEAILGGTTLNDPLNTMEIQRNQNQFTGLMTVNTTNGTGSTSGYRMESNGNMAGLLIHTAAAFTPVVGRQADSVVLAAGSTSTQVQISSESATGFISFYTGGGSPRASVRGNTGATTGRFEMNNGVAAAVSTAGTGAIRYNDSTGTFQVSISGAAYVDLATEPEAGPWDITGTVVHLDTATNNVTVGSATNLGKFAVDGDTDEIQLLVQGHSTQTAELVVFEQSGGANVWAIDNLGNLVHSQQVSATGSPTAYSLTAAAHTTLTASTEASDINFNLARTVQFATGALATQRAVQISAPTYAFVAASTITTAATVAITGSPVAGTNATITNSYSLLVTATAITGQDQVARFDVSDASSDFFEIRNGIAAAAQFHPNLKGRATGSSSIASLTLTGSVDAANDSGTVPCVRITSVRENGITTNSTRPIARFDNNSTITMDVLNGQIAVAVGSAALPGIVFAGSLTTGFFRQAADSIGISIATTEAYRIDASSNFTMRGNFDFTPATDDTGEIGTAALAWTAVVGHTIRVVDELRLDPNSPASIGVDQDDYDPGDTALARLTSSADVDVTGLAPTGGNNDGRVLVLINVGSNPIRLQNQDAASAAANRIITATGGQVSLFGDDSVTLVYDGTTARWRVIS